MEMDFKFMETSVIREIRPGDNAQVARVIRSVMEEMGVPKVGTAYADEALDQMYGNYRFPGAGYFVAENKGQIIGSAGIAPLAGSAGHICELQKMYFLKEARGMGLGSRIIKKCLDFASDHGFEKCYLETMPYMKAAQKLYLKNEFEYIDAPMGDTGHYSCTVWMLKDIGSNI